MTVLGLPPESWLLVGAAVGIGLAIEIAYFAAHRRRRAERPPAPPPAGDATSSPGGEASAPPRPSGPAP